MTFKYSLHFSNPICTAVFSPLSVKCTLCVHSRDKVIIKQNMIIIKQKQKNINKIDIFKLVFHKTKKNGTSVERFIMKGLIMKEFKTESSKD